MASSMQQPALGSKSSKFVNVNPLDPFIKPFDNEDTACAESSSTEPSVLAENLNRRLEEHVIQQRRIQQKPQQMQQQRQEQSAAAATVTTNHSQASARRPSAHDPWDNDRKEGSDSDLDDDDDDDPVLASIRERRLEQLRAAQRLQNRNESRGHGEVRTISQDDFLPECLETTSRFVAVHFFHRQFERCRILDHHLRIVASRHVECKFVRIDAERAPFFARKLSIRTLPTLVVFEKGQVLDRLIGFDGLESPTSDPDRWKTSQLQVWLGRAGAIEYDPLLLRDDDDEDSGGDDDDDNNDANPMGLSRGIRRVQSRHRISED